MDEILIIGAAGFIGRRVRERLRGRYRLISVDKVEFDAVDEEEQTLVFDLRSAEDVEAVWQEVDTGSLSAVIFLAAYYDFKNSDDPRYGEVSAGLKATLIQMGETLGPQVPLIFSSSMAAMAPTEPGVALKPESPRLGAWAYPRHKIEAESILEEARIANPRVELVLAGVYSDWCELVPLYKQIERLRRRSIEAFFYPGPTDRGLTYVHVDDVASAFELATKADYQRPVHRYLVGEEKPATYQFIHDTASEVFYSRRMPLFRVPRFVAWFGALVLGLFASILGKRRFVQTWMVQFAGEHFEFDISRTRAELDWKPEHLIHDELAGICERARDQTDTWKEKNDARPY